MPIEQANVKSWGATPATEEKTSPSERCKNPERWTAYSPIAPEVEVLKLVRSLVRTVKPNRVVICGDETGDISAFIGHALRENGFGAATVCGITDRTRDAVFGRVASSGLLRWVQILEPEAMDVGSGYDMFFLDCPHDAEGKLDKDAQLVAYAQLMENMAKGGLAVVHDSNNDNEHDDVIALPTPRGLIVVQK